MTPRPHPFTLVFGALAEEHFPAIRDAVGTTPSLDHFLLAEAVVDLLALVRPDGGIGEAMDDFVAFTHAAYCFWAAGAETRELDAAATRALCTAAHPVGAPVRATEYIQLAPRLVWAQLADGEPHEPLDGWFVMPGAAGLRCVACFGVHPERPGLSVVALVGGAPGPMAREDGTPLFAPTMEGGEAAGLYAVAAPEELLLLAWRAGGTSEER
jgi:hypothetical protein